MTRTTHHRLISSLSSMTSMMLWRQIIFVCFITYLFPFAKATITPDPTSTPTSIPTSKPTAKPSSIPTSRPTSKPTSEPTSAPTSIPTSRPTSKPTSEPTSAPTSIPTSRPTSKPTSEPTAPTSIPTSRPTSKPTSKPTSRPTPKPSPLPTLSPTISFAPTPFPTFSMAPTVAPSHYTRSSLNCLKPGEKMSYGDYMVNIDRTVAMMISSIGTICTYSIGNSADYTNQALWTETWCLSSVTNANPNYLTMDYNGFLLLYDTNGKSYWRTSSATSYGQFTLRNDGNLVLYDAFKYATWQCAIISYSYVSYGYSEYAFYASSACPTVSTTTWIDDTCSSSSYPTIAPTTYAPTIRPSNAPTIQPSASFAPSTRAPSISPTKFKSVAPTYTTTKNTCIAWYSNYIYPGDYMLSSDGSKAAKYNTDGDLCIYDTLSSPKTSTWTMRWCLGVKHANPGYMYLDSNGVLQLINNYGVSYWRSYSGAGYYAGYVQLKNNGELTLVNSYGSTVWSCNSIYNYYGYDGSYNIVYMSSACPYDYSASYDSLACTTSALGPSASPTSYPVYDYSYTDDTTSTTTTTVVSIVIPVVLVTVAIIAAILKNRARMNMQVIPLGSGGGGGGWGGGFGSSFGNTQPGGYSTTQVGRGNNFGSSFPPAEPLGGGGAVVGGGIGGYPAPQPVGGVAGYPAPQTVGGSSGMVIGSTYPGTALNSSVYPSTYQTVPQSMTNPQMYGPVTGVQMTTLGGGGGGGISMPMSSGFNYGNNNGMMLGGGGGFSASGTTIGGMGGGNMMMGSGLGGTMNYGAPVTPAVTQPTNTMNYGSPSLPVAQQVGGNNVHDYNYQSLQTKESQRDFDL